MGKKSNASNSLGRSLIKDRFSSKKRNRTGESLLHTSELNDGRDWGRLNLDSVTDQNSFEEFLATAQLAETDFQAEKLNVKFVYSNAVVKPPTIEENEHLQEKRKFITIPRRPNWNELTTKEELDSLERQSFLEWRRNLSLIQETDGVVLTPYERNLEFWRQLWRVIERSDVVVQIVDARNPLLFYSQDLESYVSDMGKKSLLLANKADLLTKKQREIWAAWFVKHNIEAVFFSAKEAAEENQDTEKEEGIQDKIFENEKNYESISLAANEEGEEEYRDALSSGESNLQESSEEEDDWADVSEGESEKAEEGGRKNGLAKMLDKLESAAKLSQKPSPIESKMCSLIGKWKEVARSGKLLGKMDLIDLFESVLIKERGTVGLVGYPNVGKSSTINALLGHKKVSVSATPGKTKHFQTMDLTRQVTLCDCPGLVMPSLAENKASMVLSGILPADRGGNLSEPVALLASLVGRLTLEKLYSVIIPKPGEAEDQNRPPTAEEFLGVYAYSRGFMTAGGRADTSRAARYVVKDFVNGKLIHVKAPPDIDQSEFDSFGSQIPEKKVPPAPITAQAFRATQMKPKAVGLDETFFKNLSLGSHTKGLSKNIIPIRSESRSTNNDKPIAKPWKDHSEKRNKREKLRRVYRHLDE